ncbi:putative toxin-antitoxin system toxin component, PIN family [Candidatus Pyrohabitans sp.]
MKIVLDTNVVVSGFLWRGKPSEILERIDSEEAQLLLSVEILEEVERVLEDQKLKSIIESSGQNVKVIMNKLYSMAKIINPQIKLNAVQADPADNKVIECAVEGKADYIVSGDRHLLNLQDYKGIRIVKASEMAEILKQQNQDENLKEMRY